jgi:hypothetical protein
MTCRNEKVRLRKLELQMLTLKASVNDVVHDTAGSMPFFFAFCKKKVAQEALFQMLRLLS